MRPIVGLHAWVALACMATATTALAQPSAEASARAAFDRGLAAETAGRNEEACTHFRESLSLQRELGPLLKVKGCDVREGKLVAARRGLRELIGRWVEPGQDLEALKAELTRVEARIAHVTVRLGTASIERVEIDGVRVTVPTEDLELDPGPHELVVEVVGQPVQRSRLELGDGERRTLTVGEEKAAPKVVAPPTLRPRPRDGGIGTLGVVGIVGLGLGGLGLVGAAVTGGLVLQQRSDFEAGGCADSDTQSCKDIASKGESLLLANGISWGVGLGAAALGTTLIIIDIATRKPSAPSVKAALSPLGASAVVAF